MPPTWRNSPNNSRSIWKKTIATLSPWRRSKKSMTSRNWPNEFVRACATISLLLCWPLGARAAQTQLPAVPAQPPAAQSKTPAIALLDADDAVQWRGWMREPGWQVIAPPGTPAPDIDSRVRALVAAVESAVQNGSGDPARGDRKSK